MECKHQFFQWYAKIPSCNHHKSLKAHELGSDRGAYRLCYRDCVNGGAVFLTRPDHHIQVLPTRTGSSRIKSPCLMILYQQTSSRLGSFTFDSFVTSFGPTSRLPRPQEHQRYRGSKAWSRILDKRSTRFVRATSSGPVWRLFGLRFWGCYLHIQCQVTTCSADIRPATRSASGFMGYITLEHPTRVIDGRWYLSRRTPLFRTHVSDRHTHLPE